MNQHKNLWYEALEIQQPIPSSLVASVEWPENRDEGLNEEGLC